MNEKVIILTESGTNIGIGHIMRCTSLYKEIQNRGFQVEMLINSWMNMDFSGLEGCYCIVDSYLAEIDILNKISYHAKKALFIDDYKRLDYPKGYVVNPSLYGEELDYKKDNDVKYLLGPSYIILRDSFRRKFVKSINPEIKEITITMGGADPNKYTIEILNQLINEFPNINKNVVLGPYFNGYNHVSKISDSSTHIHRNIDDEMMIELILNSDMVISASGQTCHELVQLRTPSLLICAAENQRKNLEYMVKNEFTIEFKLNNLIDEFIKLNYFKRMDMSNKMSKFNFSHGVGNIVKEFLENNSSCKEDENITVRKAKSSDCDLIFKLSSDPYVRSMSISKKEILYRDHIRWFHDVLKDKNIVIYVCETFDGEFIGQIKFNLTEDFAVVSISIDEKFRGKGYGKQALNLAISEFCKNYKYVQSFIAFIYSYNKSSKQLFRSLGFEYESSDKDLEKYQLKLGDGKFEQAI